MRADVNVSVCRVGGYDKFRESGDFKHLGTRCEIKNVNSLRFIAQAVEYESRRQVEIIEGGGRIKQETRLYDAKAGETRAMRSKEEAHDYRYSPIPTCCRWNWTASGWKTSGNHSPNCRTGRNRASWRWDCQPMMPRSWSPNASSRIITKY